MFEINLIKERALTKKIRDGAVKTIITAGICASLLFFIMAAYYLSLSLRVNRYSEEIIRLRTDNSALSGRFAIDGWRSDWTELYRKVKAVANSLTDREPYAARLAGIGMLLPDGVHIQKITSGLEGDGIITVALLTRRETRELIEEYAEALRESGLYYPVIVAEELDEFEAEGQRLLRFRVSISN